MKDVLKLIAAALLIGFQVTYETGSGWVVLDWIHAGLNFILIGFAAVVILALIYAFIDWLLDCIAMAVCKEEKGESENEEEEHESEMDR